MTEYRLAASGADYAKAHELVRAEGLPDHELSYPTILAVKDGELTGLLSTHIQKNMIIAGPMVLRSGAPRYWTLIRLIETYENVMRSAGISAFVFSVDEATSAKWLEKVDWFGLKPYADQDGRKFYVRNLDGHEGRSSGTDSRRNRASG